MELVPKSPSDPSRSFSMQQELYGQSGTPGEKRPGQTDVPTPARRGLKDFDRVAKLNSVPKKPAAKIAQGEVQPEPTEIEEILRMLYLNHKKVLVVWNREESRGNVDFFVGGIPVIRDDQSTVPNKISVLFPPGSEGSDSDPKILEENLAKLHWVKIIAKTKNSIPNNDDTKKQNTMPRSLAELFNFYPHKGAVMLLGDPDEREHVEKLAMAKGNLASEKKAQAGNNKNLQAEAKKLEEEHLALEYAIDKGYWKRVDYMVGAETLEELELFSGLVASYSDVGLFPVILETVWRKEQTDDGIQMKPYTFSQALEDENVIEGNTGFISRLAYPPQQEVPGIIQRSVHRFALNQEVNTVGDKRQIEIGHIVDPYWKPLRQRIMFSYQDILDGFVAFGPPDSGKTNTLFAIMGAILQDNMERNVKAKEKGLLKADDNVNLLIITTTKAQEMEGVVNLTDEPVVRLRAGNSEDALLGINPLDPLYPRLLEKHLSLIHQAFLNDYHGSDQDMRLWRDYINYIFHGDPTLAVLSVYQRLGWNIVTGDFDPGFLGTPPMPKMQMMLDVGLEEVKKQDYAKMLSSMDAFVREAVSRFTQGVLGRFLADSVKLDISKLFEYHTIIELDDIPDKQDQSFILNLLLIYMREYMQNQAKERNSPEAQPLGTLLVLDELHNLFDENPGSNEHNNATNTMFQLLQEQRWYGEGYLGAAQMPENLPSQLIKLPGNKLSHQLVNTRDIKLVLEGMGLEDTPENRAHLASFDRGVGLFYNRNMKGGPAVITVDYMGPRLKGNNTLTPPDILMDEKFKRGYHGEEFAETVPNGIENERARDILYKTQEGLNIEFLAEVLLVTELMGLGRNLQLEDGTRGYVRLKDNIIDDIHQQVMQTYGSDIDNTIIKLIPVGARRIIGSVICEAMDNAMNPHMMDILRYVPDNQIRPRREYRPLGDLKHDLTLLMHNQIFGDEIEPNQNDNFTYPPFRDQKVHVRLAIADLARANPDMDLTFTDEETYQGKTAQQEYERFKKEEMDRGWTIEAIEDLAFRTFLSQLTPEQVQLSPDRVNYKLRIEALTGMKAAETGVTNIPLPDQGQKEPGDAEIGEVYDSWMSNFIHLFDETFDCDEMTKGILTGYMVRMVNKYRNQMEQQNSLSKGQQNEMQRMAAAAEAQADSTKELNVYLKKFLSMNK